MNTTWKFLTLVTLSLALSGCGPGGSPVYKAGGSVTYKDQPVANAVVTYVYDDGNFASGSTDAAGKYEVAYLGRTGAAIGSVKVTVAKSASTGSGSTAPKDPNKMTPEERKAQQADMMKMIGQKAPKSEIPEKYGNPGTTDLKTEVKASGVNDYPIVLKD